MEQKDTKENSYSHGKIYKLIDNTTGMFYYGSTTQKRLDQRFFKHKCQSKTRNSKVYQNFTFAKFCSGDIRIVLLEEVTVNNKVELIKIENEYIEKDINNVLCLNTRHSISNVAQRIKRQRAKCKEYNQENKENISAMRKDYYDKNIDIFKEKNKKYREEHKERVKEIEKKYYEDNKDKVIEYKKQYYQINKERYQELSKQYRNDHKDEIALMNKTYRLKNKENILEKQREKCTCECGSIFTKYQKKQHEASKKHQEYITLVNQ